MPELGNNSSSEKSGGQAILIIPAVVISLPLFGLLVILSVLGNCLVVTAVKNNPKLQTVTNYFIVSLAASDLLIGMVSVPLWMRNIARRFPNVPPDCFHKVWISSDVAGGVASIFNLTLISYERYLCISTPLLTHLHMTKRKAKAYVSTIWLLSLGLGALQGSLGYEIPKPFKEIFFPLACFALPLFLMAFNYLRIFKLARHQMHKMSANIPSKMAQGIMKKELKATKTIGIVIGVFALCWTPFFVLNVLYGICSCWIKVPSSLILVAKWLHYLNSVLNPVIYTWRNQEFRNEFLKVLETTRRSRGRAQYRRGVKEPETGNVVDENKYRNYNERGPEQAQQEVSI